MKYCVNCRTPFERPSGACPECHSDQTTPDEIIAAATMGANNPWRRGTAIPVFGYPGESAALILAVLVSVVILAVAGVVSFGVFILVVGLNLIYLVLDHIRNPQTMLAVTEHSFKNVHRLARLAAFRLQIPMPPVFLDESQDYNAYTKGFNSYGFVVVNSSLVRDFRPLELLFILGHEMGHIKRRHTTWLSLTSPARVSGAKFVFAPVMQMIFNVWSVKSEYTADQAGLLACRDLSAGVMAMLKLAGGADVEKEVDFAELVKSTEAEPTLSSSLLEYVGTHPFARNRIRQLISFAGSRAYRSSRSH